MEPYDTCPYCYDECIHCLLGERDHVENIIKIQRFYKLKKLYRIIFKNIGIEKIRSILSPMEIRKFVIYPINNKSLLNNTGIFEKIKNNGGFIEYEKNLNAYLELSQSYEEWSRECARGGHREDDCLCCKKECPDCSQEVAADVASCPAEGCDHVFFTKGTWEGMDPQERNNYLLGLYQMAERDKHIEKYENVMKELMKLYNDCIPKFKVSKAETEWGSHAITTCRYCGAEGEVENPDGNTIENELHNCMECWIDLNHFNPFFQKFV